MLSVRSVNLWSKTSNTENIQCTQKFELLFSKKEQTEITGVDGMHPMVILLVILDNTNKKR